jgi:OOP family OmpA-OmpF porin
VAHNAVQIAQEEPMNRPLLAQSCAVLLAAVCATAVPSWAAPGDKPVAPLAAGKAADDKSRTRSASLPAKGLFVRDQLSDSTKAKLTELILGSIGMRIEVALLVPTGNWKIDGAGKSDRDLTAARLQSLRRFLTDRGVDPKKIFIESRVDPKIKTPRLDVQLVTSPVPRND